MNDPNVFERVRVRHRRLAGVDAVTVALAHDRSTR
jgi:hypothetical protein